MEDENSNEIGEFPFPEDDLSSGDSIIFYTGEDFSPGRSYLDALFHCSDESSICSDIYHESPSSHGTIDLVSSSDDSEIEPNAVVLTPPSDNEHSKIGKRYILGSEGVEPEPRRSSRLTDEDVEKSTNNPIMLSSEEEGPQQPTNPPRKEHQKNSGLRSCSPITINSEEEEHQTTACSVNLHEVGSSGLSSNPINLNSEVDEPEPFHSASDQLITKILESMERKQSPTSSSSTTEIRGVRASDEDVDLEDIWRRIIFHGDRKRKLDYSSSDNDDHARPGPSKVKNTGFRRRRRIVTISDYSDESD